MAAHRLGLMVGGVNGENALPKNQKRTGKKAMDFH